MLFNYSWEHLIYQLGCQELLIRYVVKRGRVVVDRDASKQLQC